MIFAALDAPNARTDSLSSIRSRGKCSKHSVKFDRMSEDHLPMQPSLNAVHDARELLTRHLSPTRLIEAPYLSRVTDNHIHLKLETDLPTGSFKVRGAVYTLLVNLARGPIRQVVASSTGNHGAAVAYAARLLEIPAKIFLPAGCNPVKRKRIAALGAEIVEQGRDITDAFTLAAEACAGTPGSFFLNDAADPDLPAGPGVIAMEILEQNPSVRTIVVPIGDTALIRGIAATAKQISTHMKVIGVQSERAPSYYLSWKNGRAVKTDSCDTMADGLATRTPAQANVDTIRQVVDDFVLVRELLQAVQVLLLQEHIVAEPAGAASTAALLKQAALHGENVVLIVSGLNIAPDVLRQALATVGR
jgi:threonine dehydratase